MFISEALLQHEYGNTYLQRILCMQQYLDDTAGQEQTPVNKWIFIWVIMKENITQRGFSYQFKLDKEFNILQCFWLH